MKAPTSPCAECPWRREAAPGWLGPFDTAEWLLLAHSDEPVACHLTLDQARPRHCAGADIYRSNVCKRPRGIDHTQLPADFVRVFTNPAQFTSYHTQKEPS